MPCPTSLNAIAAQLRHSVHGWLRGSYAHLAPAFGKLDLAEAD
jgi:hypothetical protein